MTDDSDKPRAGTPIYLSPAIRERLGLSEHVDLDALHEHSYRHRAAVLASEACGCFYCLRVFAPSAITSWVERDQNETALCPHCGIDSVLPGSACELKQPLLYAMKLRWFNLTVRVTP